MTDARSTIPKVDRLLKREWVEQFGHARVVQHARTVLAEARLRAETGIPAVLPDLLNQLALRLNDGLSPVINGTGVLLHTNLGRAPWSQTKCC